MRRDFDVRITNKEVIINGRDIGHIITQAQVTVRPDSYPLVRLEIDPWMVEYEGRAEVSRSDHDGIARLRARVERMEWNRSFEDARAMYDARMAKLAASDPTLARILLEDDYEA
jgi:hypothetical protein